VADVLDHLCSHGVPGTVRSFSEDVGKATDGIPDPYARVTWEELGENKPV
jgi:hypothetical protein